MAMRRLAWLLVLAGGGAAAFQTTKEIVAEKKYDAGFASVELIGVCKASESEASCWNGDGGPAPDLEGDFKKAFGSSDYRYLPLRYGQKTRVALFRITNGPYGDPRGTIDPYFQQNTGSFDWHSSSSFAPGESRNQLCVALVRAELTATTGQAVTTIHRNSPPSGRIPVKEGSMLDYLGTTYAIRKIIRQPKTPQTSGAGGGSQWVVAMTAEAKEPLMPIIGWAAIDDAGLVIRVVDKDGNPVIADPRVLYELRNRENSNDRTSAAKLFEARFQAVSNTGPNPGDDCPIYTNINPAKIKAIYAYGSTSQKLTITGIPLEPSMK